MGPYYISTRNGLNKISSSEAIVRGIAEDGGLYVPSFIPVLDRSFKELSDMDYRQLASFVMGKFLPDFTHEELNSCVERAYDEKFDTPDIAPVKKLNGFFFLELHHGATAAFKDMALSVLPHLLITGARKIGIQKEIVILTATSGDTGKAALESFSGVEGTKIIVFYPNKGVSLIQERQMVTQEGPNTFVSAIEGNFDDAQSGVKSIFNDKDFLELLDKNNYMFSSANSINIGRLIPQVVYYIHAYIQLLINNEIEEGEEINIVVPTGNFGNILAAYYAGQMGLPVKRFLCASNENNVLYDFINTGTYNRMRQLKLTMSPSMDILISSNLERLIYDICNHDSKKISILFDELAKEGVFKIDDNMKERMNSFWGGFATEEQTLESISGLFNNYKYLIDTHTAVGYYVYKDYIDLTSDRTKTIIVSTASPFKFPASVLKAIASSKEAYKSLDEIELLEKLSGFTNIEIPGPLKNIGSKKIIHNNLTNIDNMKDYIAGILKI